MHVLKIGSRVDAQPPTGRDQALDYPDGLRSDLRPAEEPVLPSERQKPQAALQTVRVDRDIGVGQPRLQLAPPVPGVVRRPCDPGSSAGGAGPRSAARTSPGRRSPPETHGFAGTRASRRPPASFSGSSFRTVAARRSAPAPRLGILRLLGFPPGVGPAACLRDRAVQGFRVGGVGPAARPRALRVGAAGGIRRPIERIVRNAGEKRGEIRAALHGDLAIIIEWAGGGNESDRHPAKRNVGLGCCGGAQQKTEMLKATVISGP